ncbi:MAG: hypothetical protein HY956_01525 [Deltaproteobacteria bacterium]|nr:hypothetical protein [Deltaproteobacteria bacterium]
MAEGDIANLKNRTEAKLRYAWVHLNELVTTIPYHVGDDFERAHQESFLYHFLGAKDAFLAELNVYYNCKLPPDNLTLGELRKARKKLNKKYHEITALHNLENDDTSWLSKAKVMRDYATHMHGIARTYHHGGPHHGNVFLRNPKTGDNIEIHYVDEFSNWLSLMSDLLQKLRESAIKNNS